MSKLIATTLAVAGATAVSVGGVYLLGSKGDKHTLDYNSLNEFASKYKENKEVKERFVGELGEDSDVSSSPTEGTFFKTVDSAGGSAPEQKGYLKIQYQKGSCDGKFVGRFSWWWIFVKGDEGFIDFNLAETVKEGSEDKLKVTGVVYLLAKETTPNNVWKVKHKKEVSSDTDAKKWSASDLTTKFPKKDTSLQLDGVNDYWGFFDIATGGSSPTFSNVAPIDDACRPTLEQVKPASYEFTWTPANPSGSSDKTLKDWANSSSTWWNDIYGNNGSSSAFWDLGTKVATIKGAWTKR